MTEEDSDWTETVFSPEDTESMEAKFKRIEDDMTTIYEMVIIMPRETAIQACRAYARLGTGDIASFIYCNGMLESLINIMEQALVGDGLNPYED
jgi:hypothetical protein